MSAPQDVGEVGRLHRRRAEHVHLGRPGVGALHRRQATVLPRTGQPLGHLPADPQQLRAGSATHSQRDPAGRPVAGVPEPLGELDDAPRLGTAEGVDRLVGVADGDEVAAPAGEQLEELHLGGIGVLVLVDEQPARPLPLLTEQLRVVVELGDRLPDQLRGVVPRGVTAADRRESGDRLVLLLEGGGMHPVLAAGLPTPGGELRRADPALGRPQQQLAELGAEPGGAERGRQTGGPADRSLLLRVPAQQLGDDGVLLGRGEQPRRRVAPQQRGPAEHAVGVGVEGAGQRLADGLRDAGRDAGAQFGGGLAAERQDEDLLGVDPGLDACGHRLDDRGRLAGAGPREHEQRATGMVDDRLLRRVEPRDHGDDGTAAHEPVDRPAVTPRCATSRWNHGRPTVPGRLGRMGATPQLRRARPP